MATETATIRVTRQTHNRLAAQARARGVSLAAMLAEIAVAAERQAVFQSEREASLADAIEPGVMADQRDWETALGDGID